MYIYLTLLYIGKSVCATSRGPRYESRQRHTFSMLCRVLSTMLPGIELEGPISTGVFII